MDTINNLYTVDDDNRNKKTEKNDGNQLFDANKHKRNGGTLMRDHHRMIYVLLPVRLPQIIVFPSRD